MEEKFTEAWLSAREEARKLGVRLRPLEREKAMAQARRELSGNRDSEGFGELSRMGRLELTLEALAVKKQFTALFDDDQANNALDRLLEAGYRF